MAKKPIYLDYNATTPMDPRVLQAMTPWLLTPSNAGSRTHQFGQDARDAVEIARKSIASVIGTQPQDIYFTSGATEANNLVILGFAGYGEQAGRRHILSTAIEHKAVLEPLAKLSHQGFEVELVPPGPDGVVSPDDIARRLRDDTLLVSVMHANNETGVLQPVEEIGRLLVGSEAFFHTDASQTFGKEIDALRNSNADFVSMSGHKIYGPQGIGAVFVKRHAGCPRPIVPILTGGGQERSLRAGTVPVALAVGFGEAAAIARDESASRAQQAQGIKDRFLSALSEVEHFVNGDSDKSQPHVLNLGFPGVDSEALLMALRDEMAFSNGAACTSASYDRSHVLRAMGLPDDRIDESVRISWGPGITSIPFEVLLESVASLRAFL
jgi:cysteine desulfurase